MRKYLSYITLYLFAIGTLHAQTTFRPEQHELLYLTNHWIGSSNAAGLSFSDFQVHGNTELGYNNAGGDLHRVQEGNRKNGITFNSERFDKISDNWLAWGSFEFQMNNEKNRAWSSVFDTYNSSPYIFGDSVKSKYALQYFDLHAKISHKINEKWAIGLKLDYFAGDMSRQRDPRTRTYLVDYSAVPSLVYKISKQNTLGLTAAIRYDKEKMPSIITVQQSPKIDYYFFLGNENSYSLLDGYIGFDRQYVSLDYSLGVQHLLKNNQVNWFNSVEMVTKSQEVLGSERESPGSFRVKRLELTSKFNYQFPRHLLNVQVDGFYNAGRADEYLQERVEVRDTTNGSVSWVWNTLYTYKSRYTTDSYALNLRVSLRDLIKDGSDYSWVAGIDGQFYGFNNEYYLPYSVFQADRLRVGANGGLRVFNQKEHRVTLHAKAGLAVGLNSRLDLNNTANTPPSLGSSTFEKASFNTANVIMKPDLEFYQQQVWDYGVDIRYTFPFKVKNSTFAAQLKAFYSQQISESRGSWSSAGVSVGLITF